MLWERHTVISTFIYVATHTVRNPPHYIHTYVPQNPCCQQNKCTHTYTVPCMHTHMHACMHACTHAHTHACTHIPIQPLALGEDIDVPFINCFLRRVQLGTEVIAPPGAVTVTPIPPSVLHIVNNTDVFVLA